MGEIVSYALYPCIGIARVGNSEDEYFVGHAAARDGVAYDNTGTEPLVILRYFGPGTNPDAPAVGAYKRA